METLSLSLSLSLSGNSRVSRTDHTTEGGSRVRGAGGGAVVASADRESGGVLSDRCGRLVLNFATVFRPSSLFKRCDLDLSRALERIRLICASEDARDRDLKLSETAWQLLERPLERYCVEKETHIAA